MTGASRVRTANLYRGKTRVLTKLPGCDLIGGDAIGHTLPGNGKPIGAGEPEGAAPVGIVSVLVRTTLHDGEVRLVARQRGETLRQIVTGSGLLDVRKPGFLGHPKPEAEEDHAFGWRGRCLRSC